MPFSTEAWTSKKLSPGEEASSSAGVAALGVYERVSERGNRSGSKRWTWVSHLCDCEELGHCAIALETARAVARYEVTSFVWTIVSYSLGFLCPVYLIKCDEKIDGRPLFAKLLGTSFLPLGVLPRSIVQVHHQGNIQAKI